MPVLVIVVMLLTLVPYARASINKFNDELVMLNTWNEHILSPCSLFIQDEQQPSITKDRLTQLGYYEQVRRTAIQRIEGTIRDAWLGSWMSPDRLQELYGLENKLTSLHVTQESVVWASICPRNSSQVSNAVRSDIAVMRDLHWLIWILLVTLMSIFAVSFLIQFRCSRQHKEKERERPAIRSHSVPRNFRLPGGFFRNEKIPSRASLELPDVPHEWLSYVFSV